jgi:RNase P protein component
VQKIFFRGEVVDVMVETGRSRPPLLHIDVTAKRFPKAVNRNKVKRWCREGWRKTSFSRTPGIKVTMRVKDKKPEYHTILSDLLQAEARAFQ